MAFAEANNFTINHSTFIDNSNIIKTEKGSRGDLNGKGIQILLNAISPDASFNSQARHPPPICHPSTRRGLLDHIFQWVDAGEEDILFLDGPAGTGKTSVAQTIAARCDEQGLLVASYFFFRGSPSRSTIAPLIPTITYDIIKGAPRMRKKMKKIMDDDPSIFSKSIDVQLHKLILKLYQPSLFHWKPILGKQKRSILVIDGLDECIGDSDQIQVINLIGQLAKDKNFPMRCLITSRPEPPIMQTIKSLTVSVARVTLSDTTWDATWDIWEYFRFRFEEISSRLPSSVPHPWPSKEIVGRLVIKAGGVFIYASTVVKYVDDQDSSPITQLKHVLESPPGTTPFAELDHLYRQILLACPHQHRQFLPHILGFVLLRNDVHEDVSSISLIEDILGLSRGKVALVIRRLHSILNVTLIGTETSLSLLHASFSDFLFNQERSGDFFIDCQQEHLFLATKCIEYMGRREQRGVDSSPSGNKAVLYAWNSWVYHGVGAGESRFMDFIVKLHHCDKSSWVQTFPEDHHRLCIEELKAGIWWLQRHSATKLIDSILYDLRFVNDELEWNWCAKLLANMDVLVTVLRVFEDPGLDFFDLEEDFLVVCKTGDKPLTVLYFRYRGQTYNLAKRGASFPSHLFRRSQNRIGNYQNVFIALHCIRVLEDSTNRSEIALRYATLYWARHISLVDSGEKNILEELQYIKPPKTTTAVDVTLILGWLEAIPKSHQKLTLISLWEHHFLQLGSDDSVGITPRTRMVPRELILPEIVRSRITAT